MLHAKPMSKLSQADLVHQATYEHTKHGLGAPPALTDIAVNLADAAFKGHVTEVCSRARDAGVKTIIVSGTSVQSSRLSQQLVEEHSPTFDLYFTAGVHPHTAKTCNKDTLPVLEQLAEHPRCVAIGECGLDYNRNFSPRDVQLEWFSSQVALACRLRKTLFLHERDAAPHLIEVLRQHTLQAPVVVHCFTGSREALESYLELGCYIGITGWVCDDRAERGGPELAALLPLIPQDRLVIETDAPYLTPRTIRPSKRRPHCNEPALLPWVLATVAESLGLSLEEVAQMTRANAARLFQLEQSQS